MNAVHNEADPRGVWAPIAQAPKPLEGTSPLRVRGWVWGQTPETHPNTNTQRFYETVFWEPRLQVWVSSTKRSGEDYPRAVRYIEEYLVEQQPQRQQQQQQGHHALDQAMA
jgi:hypothetical protein